MRNYIPFMGLLPLTWHYLGMSLIKQFIHRSKEMRFYWIYDDAVVDDDYTGDFDERVISYPVVSLGVEDLDQVAERVGFRLDVAGPDARYLVESGEIAAGNERTEIAVVYNPGMNQKLTTAPREGFSTQFAERII